MMKFLVLWVSLAFPAQGKSTVFFHLVCTTPTMLVLAEAMVDPKVDKLFSAAMDAGLCRQTIGSAPVTAIIAGPFRDFEGDAFLVVEIAHGVAVLAWEGLNYHPIGHKI